MVRKLRIDGFDLSHYQDQKINWSAAKKAGAKFLYHKATQSTNFHDPNYPDRRTEAKANGVKFGAYHYAIPVKGGGTAQAKYFLAYAKPRSGDLLPVLDLEVNPNGLSEAEMTQFVADFFNEVKRQTGDNRGVIYTRYPLGKIKGIKLKLWTPRYSPVNARPMIAPPHKKFAIRQFSDGKDGVPNSLPGVGHVDLNHLRNGLQKLLWKRRLVLK